MTNEAILAIDYLMDRIYLLMHPEGFPVPSFWPYGTGTK